MSTKTGPVILVIGSKISFGTNAVAALAARGAKFIVVSNDDTFAGHLFGTAIELDAKCRAIHADIHDAETADKVVNEIRSVCDRINVVVNILSEADAATPRSFKPSAGPLYLIEALHAEISEGCGRIVNLIAGTFKEGMSTDAQVQPVTIDGSSRVTANSIYAPHREVEAAAARILRKLVLQPEPPVNGKMYVAKPLAA